MSKKEQRVINAFINCVKMGEYSYDYAVTLMENTEAYGYLTDEAKEVFYKTFEEPEQVETPIEETENVESEEIEDGERV
jgi:hypothetical protein